MRRGTTPTHIFTLPFDTDLIRKLRITYAQSGEIKLTKSGEDISMAGNVAQVKLTRAETIAFAQNRVVEIQLEAEDESGNVLVSDIQQVHPLRLLNEEDLE